MKAPLAIAAVVIVVAGAWTLLQARSDAPDPARARDRLMREDLVVEFSAQGFAEGYRVTWLKDGRWAWQRLVHGEAVDLLLFDGDRHLFRVSDGCYVELSGVSPPMLPGLTVSRELNRVGGLANDGAGSYSYALEAEGVEVTEVLGEVGSGRLRFVTSGSSRTWAGTYEVRRATGAEAESAQREMESADPSPYTAVIVRERELGNVAGSAVHGPYTIAIADECPGDPIQLWPASVGGQHPGPRGTPPQFRLRDESGPVAEGAVRITGPIGGALLDLAREAESGARGDLRLRTGLTFAVGTGERAMLGVEVVSCLSSTREPCR